MLSGLYKDGCEFRWSGYWHTNGFQYGNHKYNSSMGQLMVFCWISALSYEYVSTIRRNLLLPSTGWLNLIRVDANAGGKNSTFPLFWKVNVQLSPYRPGQVIEAPRISRQWSIVASVQVDKCEWRVCERPTYHCWPLKGPFLELTLIGYVQALFLPLPCLWLARFPPNFIPRNRHICFFQITETKISSWVPTGARKQDTLPEWSKFVNDLDVIPNHLVSMTMRFSPWRWR